MIGCVYKNPTLLDETGQYFLSKKDFVPDLHAILYGAAYDNWNNKAKSLTPELVENWLSKRPTQDAYGVFKSQKGAEWIVKAKEIADPKNFEYFYNRVKKMTVLRNYAAKGADLDWLYDKDTIDGKVKQEQEDRLDSMSIGQIADAVEDRFASVRLDCVSRIEDDTEPLGEYVDDVFESLSRKSDTGLSLYDSGGWMSGLTRGARLGKFYLRSAPSGVGKSRTMMADACFLACEEYYDGQKWVQTGNHLSIGRDALGNDSPAVLYISTELDKSEIITMAIAFLSGVNETTILLNAASPDEQKRIEKAKMLLKAAPLYPVLLPNFTVEDVENTIKRYHAIHNVQYVFYDYLGTSMAILEEMSRKTKGVSMREESILFLLASRLKDLAVMYNIFIESATQLSGKLLPIIIFLFKRVAALCRS